MPCALLVYDKATKSEDSFVEDDDYRIHYTITSAPFRKLYFAGVQMTEEKCKAGAKNTIGLRWLPMRFRKMAAYVRFGSFVILASKNLTKNFSPQHQIGNTKHDLGAQA
jgi:hypothetical protein